MTYTSKRTLLSIGIGILLLAVYVVYALGEASPASDDLKSWAVSLLVYIGACIAMGIIIQIGFHVVLAVGISAKEKSYDAKQTERIIKATMVEDEREKLINLKSNQIGYICAGFGFVIGLIAFAIGLSSVVVLHIMTGAFAVGAIAEGCVSVYLNERGVRNG